MSEEQDFKCDLYERMPSHIRASFNGWRRRTQVYDLVPEWGKANMENFYLAGTSFWHGYEAAEEKYKHKYKALLVVAIQALRRVRANETAPPWDKYHVLNDVDEALFVIQKGLSEASEYKSDAKELE